MIKIAEIDSKIISYIKRKKFVSPKEIRNKFDCKSASHKLKELYDKGEIRRKREGHNYLYYFGDVCDKKKEKEEIIEIIKKISISNICYIDDLINEYSKMKTEKVMNNEFEEKILNNLWELHKEGKILLIRGRTEDGTGHSPYTINSNHYSAIQLLD